MTICLVLFISAWAFVRLWSVPAAVGMCVVALVIPPLAAIVGNKREADDRWWDEDDDGTGRRNGGDGRRGDGPRG